MGRTFRKREFITQDEATRRVVDSLNKSLQVNISSLGDSPKILELLGREAFFDEENVKPFLATFLQNMLLEYQKDMTGFLREKYYRYTHRTNSANRFNFPFDILPDDRKTKRHISDMFCGMSITTQKTNDDFIIKFEFNLGHDQLTAINGLVKQMLNVEEGQ